MPLPKYLQILFLYSYFQIQCQPRTDSPAYVYHRGDMFLHASTIFYFEDPIMQLLKCFATTVATSMLVACTLSNEKWSNFDNQSANVNPQENRAGLIFYRTDSGATPNAVNIEVNGKYLSSLQVGGFTKTEVCAKPTTIEAHYIALKPVANLNVNLTNQSVHYFYVDTLDASKPQLIEVNAATAQEALKMLKHQANTISRVNSTNCANH